MINNTSPNSPKKHAKAKAKAPRVHIVLYDYSSGSAILSIGEPGYGKRYTGDIDRTKYIKLQKLINHGAYGKALQILKATNTKKASRI